MFVDDLVFAKRITAVDARAEQNLKRAGKRMLMDAGGAVEPVVDVDKKPRAREEGYGRVSETSFNILLFGKRRCGVHPANDLPGINACRQVGFDERLGSNIGEKLFTIVLGFPTSFYQRAEL